MPSNKNLKQWFILSVLAVAAIIAMFLVCTVFDGDAKCRKAANKADYGKTVEEMREGLEYFGENCTFGGYRQPIAK